MIDLSKATTLDRVAFSQMILAALSHDFVTPFRSATACCREIQTRAGHIRSFTDSDIRAIAAARAKVAKSLFPKLTALHDEAKRFQGQDPSMMVGFLLSRIEPEINESVSELQLVINMADGKNYDRSLDDVIDDLAVCTRKIASMMDAIRLSAEGGNRRVFSARLQETIENVEGMFSSLRQPFRLTIAGDAVIECDPGRMWSIFSNLIGNSLKYRRPEQPLEIDISVGAVDDIEKLVWNIRDRRHRDLLSKDEHYSGFLNRAREQPNWVEIRVADNGIGIPSDRIWGVFKLFKQLGRDDHDALVDSNDLQRRMIQAYSKIDSTDPRHHKGIGLGLALTQYYIRCHEGDIVVDSEIGGPTTFGFWLPLKEGSELQGVELDRTVWWAR